MPIRIIEFYDDNLNRFISRFGIDNIRTNDKWICGPITDGEEGSFRYGIRTGDASATYKVEYSNQSIGGDWQYITKGISLSDAVEEVRGQYAFDKACGEYDDESRYRIVRMSDSAIVAEIDVSNYLRSQRAESKRDK